MNNNSTIGDNLHFKVGSGSKQQQFYQLLLLALEMQIMTIQSITTKHSLKFIFTKRNENSHPLSVIAVIFFK